MPQFVTILLVFDKKVGSTQPNILKIDKKCIKYTILVSWLNAFKLVSSSCKNFNFKLHSFVIKILLHKRSKALLQ